MKKVNGMKRKIIISLCILSAVGFGNYIGTLFLAPEQPTQVPKPVPVPPQVSNNPPVSKLKIDIDQSDIVFDDVWHVKHLLIENYDELINLRVIPEDPSYVMFAPSIYGKRELQIRSLRKNENWSSSIKLIADNADEVIIKLYNKKN